MNGRELRFWCKRWAKTKKDNGCCFFWKNEGSDADGLATQCFGAFTPSTADLLMLARTCSQHMQGRENKRNESGGWGNEWKSRVLPSRTSSTTGNETSQISMHTLLLNVNTTIDVNWTGG